MTPISETIRTKIIDLRRKANLSQSQVAEFLNIEQKTYGHYETGRAKPSIDTLFQLTRLYCLSGIDELISGHAEKKTTLVDRYKSLPFEKRKIVDFILQN